MSEREELANDLRDEAEAHHADGQHGFAAKLERAAAYIASQAEYVRGLEDAALRCDSFAKTGREMSSDKKSGSATMLQSLAAESCASFIRALKNTAQAGQNAAGSNGPSRPGRVASHPEPAAAPLAAQQADQAQTPPSRWTPEQPAGAAPVADPQGGLTDPSVLAAKKGDDTPQRDVAPAGPAFVLVPREPTMEMQSAGAKRIHEIGQQHSYTVAEECYCAMLSAAPAPSVDEEAVDILRGLVALKDRKDSIGKDDTYAKMQPVLWERARAYLLAVGRKP